MVRVIKPMAVVGPILPALTWLAFCLIVFFQFHAWGVEYDRKMAMIERGEVKPETLYVVKLVYHEGGPRHASVWWVTLGENRQDGTLYREAGSVDDLHVGSPVTAYRCGSDKAHDDGYLIPRFSPGHHHWGSGSPLPSVSCPYL